MAGNTSFSSERQMSLRNQVTLLLLSWNQLAATVEKILSSSDLLLFLCNFSLNLRVDSVG
jgi:hypothetical protein